MIESILEVALKNITAEYSNDQIPIHLDEYEVVNGRVVIKTDPRGGRYKISHD